MFLLSSKCYPCSLRLGSPTAAKLLTLQVNGVELCDPLGDKNVWGSIFELNEERLGQKAILLATKVQPFIVF